jgi:hypothetical protein
MGSYPSGMNGYARVDARSPVAFAICDRCGFRYNRSDLVWNYDWRGNKLQNLRILVCRRTCLDIPNEQLRSYSPPADPLPVINPRPDESCMGAYPTIITTAAQTPTYWLRDGFGNLILDGFGNPIITEIGTYGTLIPADPGRTQVNFTIPPSFGLWINVIGGIAAPGGPGSVFYAPNSYYEVSGVAAQNPITYFTTISGLTLVVQTEDCDLFYTSPVTATGLESDGGLLILAGYTLWPSGTTTPGGFYSNGGATAIAPGGVYDPSYGPIIFGEITSAAMLAIPGQGNVLPPYDPQVFNQMYNSGDQIYLSAG